MPLLDRLCTDLTAVICEDRLQFQAIQVKQKFGGLRFYAQGGTARIRALIDAPGLPDDVSARLHLLTPRCETDLFWAVEETLRWSGW